MDTKYFKDCYELIKQAFKKCERTGCCENCVLLSTDEFDTGSKCILGELERNIKWMEKVNDVENIATESMKKFIDNNHKYVDVKKFKNFNEN